ncbi:MAG TPA: sigma-70 family RNA polymerase sigma factor [Pirellulales bacterium]|jgi:RNA polymerase sigma-70 factor (ECF subfamily)|nr:sigma-70 family RNA polymerase sigma factor [Pirellulales bacterium]
MSSAIDIQSQTDTPEALARKTDEELLMEHRLRGGRRAFELLVQRYERELYSYLRRYLSDATMAEDVFQATFLQLYLKADQFEEGRKVRPWLYTIATNQAIDAQRRNRRHKMVSLDRRGHHHDTQDDVGSLLDLLTSKEPLAVDNLETDERRQWVQQAIAELPEALREAVLLVYYQGMKYREAAEVLDIPVGTVKSRMHAAILKLNEAWTNKHPSDDE